MQITKREVSHSDRKSFIRAMWLLFLFAPSKPTPDADGYFDIGEIGSAREKNWSRVTPYSLAAPHSVIYCFTSESNSSEE